MEGGLYFGIITALHFGSPGFNHGQVFNPFSHGLGSYPQIVQANTAIIFLKYTR
jgi:hypothetical protein